MRAPFTLEDNFWKSVISDDVDFIGSIIEKDTVFYVNGKHMVGTEIIDFVKRIHCRYYTINNMEIVLAERGVVQTIYESRISLDDQEEHDYFISTTWIGSEEEKDNSPEKLRFVYVIIM